jgi:hypothetical protein
MNEMQVRIRMERMLREMARKRRCEPPELSDEEIREFCQRENPTRMAVMRFVSNKMAGG